MVAQVPRGGPGKDVGRQLWGVRARGRARSQVLMAGGGDGGCCWSGRWRGSRRGHGVDDLGAG